MQSQFQPTILSTNIKAFFFHVSCEYLLSKGWDLEEDPFDFIEKVEGGLTDKFCTINHPDGSKYHVTEYEIALAGAGIDTLGLRKYMESYGRAIASNSEATPDKMCGASMHSGSSDYLYVRDVTDYLENVVALGSIS